MSFVGERLDEAKRLLASGDIAAAVAELTAAWAKLPSTRIGAIAIRLSASLSHAKLPDKVGEREKLWLELAATGRADVVPTLLAIDWPAYPRAVKARLDLLVKFPPDPRIAASLRDLWHAGAYRSGSGSVFWRRAFRMLLNWKDPGTAAIVALAKRDDQYEILASVVDRRTKTPMPTEPELSREISAQLDAIEALAGVTREAVATKEQLLAAVYAQPSDMGARLVLADLLVAEGDPRGELIQLQHALETRRGAKTKIGARIKSLLQVSQGKWLDGLDAMVSEPVFRCGFASDVTLSKPIDPTPRAWRTVTTLRFASFATAESSASALADENLGGVTTVIGIPMQVLARWLRECGPRRFDHVDARAPLASLTVCDARIHHLAVRSSDWDATRDQRVHLDYRVAFHWFEHSALRELVKILELDGFEHLLHVAIADLARTPSLEALWLRPTSEKAWQDPWSVKPVLWEIRVSRDARGAPSVIDATWHSPYKRAVQAPRPPSRDGLVLALAALDEAALTSVTVRSVSPLSDKVQAELDRGLADALRKQRALTMFASAGAEHPLTR